MSLNNFKIKQVGLKKSLFHDTYYRVLKMSWLKFILFVAMGYLSINFIFALLYFFSPAEILNIRPNSLWDAFIFSFQTSSTVGYGYFLPQSDSAHAIVILDTMVGIFYVAIMTGLAFAKFARPNSQIVFSDKCILSTFDGTPTLMFRLANARETHLVDTKLNVAALLPYQSKEGLKIRRFHDLKLVSNNIPVFSLSWTVMHQIDQNSPLYGMSIEQMREQRLVIFATLTGIDSIMSQSIYADYRYTPEAFFNAKKFADILNDSSDNNYVLDFTKFNEIE